MNGKELLDAILQDMDDIGKENAGRYSFDEIKKRLEEAYESGLLSLRTDTFENIRRRISVAAKAYSKGMWTLEETMHELNKLYNGLASSAIEKVIA